MNFDPEVEGEDWGGQALDEDVVVTSKSEAEVSIDDLPNSSAQKTLPTSINTSSHSSTRSSDCTSPLPTSSPPRNGENLQSTTQPGTAGNASESRKASKNQSRRSSDISRSSHSPKNDNLEKKTSVESRPDFIIGSFDDSLVEFDDLNVHCSTALQTSSNLSSSAPTISQNTTTLTTSSCSLQASPQGQVQTPAPGSNSGSKLPPSTRTSPLPTPNITSTRTSPLTTPNLSFKRSHSKLSAPGATGYISEFSLASSTSATDKRAKRRSWINSTFNPTYTSRCDDLKKNFPGLPVAELLLGDYSCALQKDILVHGRMYVTTNFLCFYANIWKWETAVTVRWKDVSAMTKEKTALVIPNAIQICTGNEKLFFCSFTVRDKAHMTLFKVWQNALLDCPASETELLTWAQLHYGDRATGGKTASDVEYDASNDGGSNHSYDGGDQGPRPRLYSNIEEENEENKLAINEGSFLPDAIGDKPLRALSKKSESLPTDMSDNSESEPSPQLKSVSSVEHRKSMKPGDLLETPSLRPGIVSTDILTYEAWRQTKVAKEVLNTNFNLNIDDLFTLLFTNSKFFYDFQAERKTFDIVQCPWQASPNSDEKFRKVEFTLNLNHAMGPRTSRATEVQTMRGNSVPGHIYNVDVETTNADIPYAEYFSVLSHYCIVKVTEAKSRLTVLCDIKYKKSPWGIVKSFIDKNVWAGIDEHFSALNAALDREISIMQHKDDLPKEPSTTNLAAVKKKTRKQRHRKISVSESVGMSANAAAGGKLTGGLRPGQGGSMTAAAGDISSSNIISSHTAVGSGSSGSMNMILLCFLFLFCLLNMLLLYKFWTLEQQVVNKIDFYDKYHLSSDFPSASDLPKNNAEWLTLIRKQELKHAKDLEAWQHAVKSAAELLKQTESAMAMFSRSFQADANRKLLKHFLQQQAVEDQQSRAAASFMEQQQQRKSAATVLDNKETSANQEL